VSHIACYHSVLERQICSSENPDGLVGLAHPREAVAEVANVRTGRSLAMFVARVTIRSDSMNQSSQRERFRGWQCRCTCDGDGRGG
jgi:hypothetical protein